MGLESQSTINPRHKSRPIKADQPSIVWIKFITPSSSFGPSLGRPVLESAQISWISPLSASLIFLDLALVIGPIGTCNGSFNTLWCSSVSFNFLNFFFFFFKFSISGRIGMEQNYNLYFLSFSSVPNQFWLKMNP